MTFLRPWVLLFLPAVVAWTILEWKKSDGRGRLCLKAIVFCLVVMAIAQPSLIYEERRVAVALLADASDSISSADIRRENELIARIRPHLGSNSLEIIPFAAAIHSLKAAEAEAQLEQRLGESDTNLEVAIRDAITRLPERRVPRLLLVSDGQENAGSVERALYQARLLDIPVDTYALQGTPQSGLRLESIVLPSHAFTGERIPLELVVSSPVSSPANISIEAEGRQIGGGTVNLVKGTNRLRVQTQLQAIGTILMSGSVTAGELRAARFDRVIALRRPRVLLVSQEPESATRHLRQVLEAAHFEVVKSGQLPEDQNDYQAVMAVNSDLESWTVEQKKSIEDYVRQGGGFILIAGENNIYAEHKDDDDPVRRMLPADLTPPRKPQGNAVVLIVDKSSSMTGRKIELARRSAIGLIENLKPYDQVGVLIMDNSYQWAVTMRPADDPSSIKSLIAGIVADGGTNIPPALREAYRRIRRLDAVYKHIVLLTDGISEEGDSMSLARQALANNVTISTIGLGEDVNRDYLQKVARLAKGKSYFLTDFGDLEQLLLRDVEEHTGSSAVEKPVYVSVLRDVEMLQGIGMEKAPPLSGYLRFSAKPEAETILQVDVKDPLLIRWQYGLGRSAVFASDAKGRWAAKWLNWTGYDRFWANVLRDLLPRAPETETRAEFDRSSKEIVVRYRFQAGAQIGNPPDLYVLGPNAFRQAVRMARVTPSSYECRVPIGDTKGLFRIRPADDLTTFPEIGFYREDAERSQYGSNPELLRQIAQATGGRFNPPSDQVFDSGKRSIGVTLNLWPGLLVAALLLNLAELADRKGYSPLKVLWILKAKVRSA